MWFLRSPGALYRSYADEVMLASVDREGFDLLSGTGDAVWRLLETPQTLDGLTESLSRAYGADPTVIAGDVARLLDELVARGFVEEVSDADD